MRFGVLGPLRVADEAGGVRPIPGARRRVLLATLLVRVNRVVPAGELAEIVWDAAPPAGAAAALVFAAGCATDTHTAASSGARLQSLQVVLVASTDPDALAAEFSSRNVQFSEQLKDTDDGLRGFELKDTDGYVLFFGCPRS